MLTIGYARQRDDTQAGEIAELDAAGCQVVRVEVSAAGDVLGSILDFIGHGDQLVVTRLDRLASSGRGLRDALQKLEDRGASLRVLAPAFDSQGASGRALRAVLEAVAGFEPGHPVQGRRAAAALEIVSLYTAGVGPVEIARRLGVSRMTVWRRLRSYNSTHV